MIDYIKGNVSLNDVIQSFDENQSAITDNKVTSYTKVTKTIEAKSCAKLVGISFAKAVGADAALVSLNPWRMDLKAFDMNQEGVSGALFPMKITDEELTSILPTGWNGNIQTVTLKGSQIKKLMKTGYQRKGNNKAFPYVMSAKKNMKFKDGKTYKVVICGATDKVKKEGNIKDSGILGLDAARTYVSQFKTMDPKDIKWE